MADPEGDNLWRATTPEAFSAPALDGEADADLVVVGGGITGCAAALQAARDGLDVRLLEAADIGFGGSGRNVGLVNAGLWMPPDEIQGVLGNETGERLNTALAAGPEQVFALIDAHRIACNAVHNGTLHCAHAPAGVEDLRSRLAQQQARGAPVALLDADETRARTGSHAFYGAMFDERAGTLEPFAYTRGLARAAAESGARLHEQTPAGAIERRGEGWRVATPAGAVTAGALLLATNAYHARADGAWSPAFTPVHFFQFATTPLDPRRLESILPGLEGCWDTGTVMSSLRRDADGRLLVGSIGSLAHAGSGIHRQWARRKLARLYPELRDQPLEHAWHGRIAMTRDHLPRIGRCVGPGYAIFGYSGRGIAPGTVFGTAAARALAMGDESHLPIPAIDQYAESATGVRAKAFELGALADHVAWMGRDRFHHA